MRFRLFRALVLFSFLLLTTVPAVAAQHDERGECWIERHFPVLAKVVKAVKRTFGVSANDDGLTLPTP